MPSRPDDVAQLGFRVVDESFGDVGYLHGVAVADDAGGALVEEVGGQDVGFVLVLVVGEGGEDVVGAGEGRADFHAGEGDALLAGGDGLEAGAEGVEVGDDAFHEVFGGHDADVLEFAGDVDDAVSVEDAHTVVVEEEELHWRASNLEWGRVKYLEGVVRSQGGVVVGAPWKAGMSQCHSDRS